MPYIVKSSLDIGGKIIPWNEREAETLIKEKEQVVKEKEEKAGKVEKVEEPKQEKQEKQEISRRTEVKVKNRKE